jgi:hypothetical protein
MRDFTRKQYFMAGLVFLVATAAGIYGVSQAQTPGNNTSQTDWKQITLEDVSTGEEYTVAELEKPVLVETFAVWCPTCTRQQQEVKKFHEDSNVSSVSLDVDPNEDASKVRQHIQRYNFDWRYSVAPSELTRLMVQEYGNDIAHPPSAPMILVCEDGTRKLPSGVKPVSKLQEEVNKGC